MKEYLLLISLVIFVSCGNQDKSNRRDTHIEQTDIEEVMDHQNFECAPIDGSCPTGMARLLIINPFDPEHSGACSGFMVSKTQLVTNHHCVSDDMECAFTFVAIYNGSTYQKARCKNIVKTDQDVDDANDPSRAIDYTVMELDETFEGKFFPLSREEAKPGDQVNVWVIDHTGLDKSPSNLLDSRVTEFNCTVSDQTQRASLLMNKCPIISGNSGSPAVNTEGEIVGVIWGGNATIIDTSVSLSIRRKLSAIGLATEVDHFRNYVEN